MSGQGSAAHKPKKGSVRRDPATRGRRVATGCAARVPDAAAPHGDATTGRTGRRSGQTGAADSPAGRVPDRVTGVTRLVLLLLLVAAPAHATAPSARTPHRATLHASASANASTDSRARMAERAFADGVALEQRGDTRTAM